MSCLLLDQQGSGKVSGEEVDVRDSMGNGLTPFLLACACGNAAMVRLLLDYGADGTACDSRGMNGYHFLATPNPKGHAWCVLTDKCILAKKFRYPRYNSQTR